MRRVLSSADAPGVHLLMDGDTVCGVWLALGVVPGRGGAEGGALASFERQPATFRDTLDWLLDQGLAAVTHPQSSFLIAVEWTAELLVRTPLGPDFDANPALGSGVAVCRVRRATGLLGDLRGEPCLVVSQVFPSGLADADRANPDAWLRRALEGGADGSTADPGVSLPPGPGAEEGGRALVMVGFLDRQLLYQVAPPDAVLLSRPVEGSLSAVLGLRTSAAALGLALILGVLFAIYSVRFRLAEAAPAPGAVARADLPVGLCSPGNAPFRDALRCQIAQMTRQDALDPACGAAAQAAQRGADLQADLCGLLDRGADGWFAAPLAGTGKPVRDYGELALSQACFQVLGSPGSYALETSGTGLQWGDPDRLLRGPDAIGALQDLETDELATCKDSTDHLRAYVEGAVVSSHVGGPGSAEARALADAGDAAVEGQLTATDRPCFQGGTGGSTAAQTYSALCKGAPPAQAGALSGAASDPVVDRYLRARFGADLGKVSPKDNLWDCHLSLSGAHTAGSAAALAGAWTFPVPVPSAYGAGHGATSELALDAALLGMRAGTDLGVCWGEVESLLGSFAAVHPLFGAVDPKGWPQEGQQVCGQICRAAYGLGTPSAARLTPDADLAACLSTAAPTGSTTGFPLLALPWNGQTPAAPPATSRDRWTAPAAAQICAFHLLAQGDLDLGRKAWMPAGLTGLSWAGEVAPGVAGGAEGAAAASAEGFAGARTDTRAGELECGSVALQCFSGLAMEVAGTGSRTRWTDRFGTAVVQLSRADPAAVAAREPWCGLVDAWLAQKPVTEQIDATCRTGVEEARAGIAAALTLAGSSP